MAKTAVQPNPYAAPEEITDTPTYALPNSPDFAAPGLNEENGTLDSPIGAYSPDLRAFPGGVPDPMRIRLMPARDARPDPARAPEDHYRRLDADDRARHSVEEQDADGWEERKGGSGKPAAPNPRSRPPQEPRPTSRLAPRTYLFVRPFWGGPRDNNGEHFSMADHRRDYPIMGTQPVRTWRNTYRISPAPFDTDMVDMPADPVPDVSGGIITSPQVPLETTRTWRL